MAKKSLKEYCVEELSTYKNDKIQLRYMFSQIALALINKLVSQPKACLKFKSITLSFLSSTISVELPSVLFKKYESIPDAITKLGKTLLKVIICIHRLSYPHKISRQQILQQMNARYDFCIVSFIEFCMLFKTKKKFKNIQDYDILKCHLLFSKDRDKLIEKLEQRAIKLYENNYDHERIKISKIRIGAGGFGTVWAIFIPRIININSNGTNSTKNVSYYAKKEMIKCQMHSKEPDHKCVECRKLKYIIKEYDISKTLNENKVPHLIEYYDKSSKPSSISPKKHSKICMYMEYVNSPTLESYFNQNYCFTEKEIRAIMKPLAESLAVIHKLKIIHRDIKPKNILVQIEHEEANVRLIDFGVSCEFEGNTTIVGGYCAPEMYTIKPDNVEKHKYGVKSDIYSYGAILYKLLYTQDIPIWDNKAIVELYYARHPLTINSKVKHSAAAISLLSKCLNFSPEIRISSEALLDEPFLDPNNPLNSVIMLKEYVRPILNLDQVISNFNCSDLEEVQNNWKNFEKDMTYITTTSFNDISLRNKCNIEFNK